LAAACLWLVVSAVALETFAVLRTRASEKAARAYADEWSRTSYQAEQAYIQKNAPEAPAPPSGLKGDVPPREALARLDATARDEFAAQRSELILLCDRSGAVVEKHGGEAPAAVARLARLVTVGEPLTGWMPAVEGPDALVAIGQVFDSSRHVPREYTITLPGQPPFVYEFLFYPLKDLAGTVEQCAVFIRESMWEETWLRFRANVYRNDAYEFWTNSLGWRDDEVALPNPPGLYRVVCVGGSTTAEGVRNDLTYPKMLDRMLKARFGAERVEALNCGVFALGSGGERLRTPDYLALEPDLIIHYNFVNDVLMILDDSVDPPAGPARFLQKAKSLLSKSTFAYRHFNWRLLPPEEKLVARIEQRTLDNLRHVLKEARKAGAELAIASFACPDVANLGPQERGLFDSRINNMLWGRVLDMRSYARLCALYNARVKALCEEEGLLYIPVAENLQGGSECFTDICHVTLPAMEEKARIVFEHIAGPVAARLDGRKDEPK